MDVKSLYTSISSHEGTEAVKEKLNVQSKKPIAAKVTFKPLFLILTLNNFIFNSINYLQINKCAIRTICPPSYENIFIEKIELTDIFSYINDKITTCSRYIDDLFFIWKATQEELL